MDVGNMRLCCRAVSCVLHAWWWRSLAAPCALIACTAPQTQQCEMESPTSKTLSYCILLLELSSKVKIVSMSGFEVAGIVLGALPLIIFALENLRDGASRLGRLVNFNAEYHKLWGEVEDEELMYRLQLKKLLKPLVRDDVLANDDLEALLLDPCADSWREPDLEKALKARLGEAYGRYLANVRDIQRLAWDMLQPLVQSSTFQQRIDHHKVSRPASAQDHTYR
jgi:hypothetical protein